MRRLTVPGAVAIAVVLAVVLTASPAGAHTVLEPATAAPGSVIELTLVLADEEPDGGTELVEVQFPEPLTVVALPEVPGWTATLVDGEVGGPAAGVAWSGGPAPDDLRLPITVGPLPTEPGRLQFPTVQTYDNGVIASWIQDWPEGAPEPDNPAPVLDLVVGGPGSIPPSTTTSTTTTTEGPTTTAAEEDDEEAAPQQADDGDDDSDSSALPLVIGVLVVLGIAAGTYAVARSRRASGSSGDSGGGDSGGD
ncbi:MAG: DUF1775 domain-containing protein [Acidimicrobiales bacterium]